MPVRRSALVLVPILAAAVMGAATPDGAVAAVKKTLDAALAIARSGGSHDDNLTALRAAARDILDTRAMGRRAMGNVLAAQPPEQQQAYLELFDQLILRAYLQKLLLFHDPHFDYGEPQANGDVVIVRTRIVTSKDEYHVDYEMREHDGRWAATDVIVEGISLTDNYKSQFASLLRDRSFQELLDLMRSKTRPVGEEPTT
jgi:phospholipid transport system substrate-binding protein